MIGENREIERQRRKIATTQSEIKFYRHKGRIYDAPSDARVFCSLFPLYPPRIFLSTVEKSRSNVQEIELWKWIISRTFSYGV